MVYFFPFTNLINEVKFGCFWNFLGVMHIQKENL